MLAQRGGAEVPMGTYPTVQTPPVAYDYSPAGYVPTIPQQYTGAEYVTGA